MSEPRRTRIPAPGTFVAVAVGTLCLQALAVRAQPQAAGERERGKPSRSAAKTEPMECLIKAWEDETTGPIVAQQADAFEKVLSQLREQLRTPQQIIVTLDRPPLSRTRLLLDSDRGEHLELEWDPSKSMRMSRSLVVRRERKWHLTVATDPVLRGNSNGGTALDYLVVRPSDMMLTPDRVNPWVDDDQEERALRKRARELLSRCSAVPLKSEKPTTALPRQLTTDDFKRILEITTKLHQDMYSPGILFGRANDPTLRGKLDELVTAANPQQQSRVLPTLTQLRAHLAVLDEAVSARLKVESEDREGKELGTEITQLRNKLLETLQARWVVAARLAEQSPPEPEPKSAAADKLRPARGFVLSTPGKNGPDEAADPLRVTIEVRSRASGDGDSGKPSFADAIERMPSPITNGEDLRSLADPVPGVVSDVMQLLAEIAFERAKSRSFAILSARMTELLCEKLVVPSLPGSSSSTKLLFPRTCELVRNLRLQELGSSAKPMLQAMLSDFATQAFYALRAELGKVNCSTSLSSPCDYRLLLLDDVLTSSMQLLVDAVADPSALSRRRSQLLLLEFGNRLRDRLKSISEREKIPLQGMSLEQQDSLIRLACPLELALAITSECVGSAGRCDARMLMDMVEDPKTYFRFESYFNRPNACFEAFGIDATLPPEVRARISRWVTRMMELAAPPKGMTAQAQLLALTDLLFDILASLPALSKSGSSSVEPQRLLALLPDLRALVRAIIQPDAQAAVVSGAQLIVKTLLPALESQWSEDDKRAKRLIERTMQLAAAVASYTQNYSGDDQQDAKQAAAQREARKKAIESLIDQATDRTGREGDTIVSFGANVGFQVAGYQRDLANASAPNAAYVGQLSLPIGLSIERLPRACSGKLPCWGWHIQISPLDVAQFISYNLDRQISQVHWANFVMVGVQPGFLVHFGKKKDRPSPWESLFIGADIRYAPSQTFVDPTVDPSVGSGKGLFRAGLYLGYYVPFFDIN